MILKECEYQLLWAAGRVFESLGLELGMGIRIGIGDLNHELVPQNLQGGHQFCLSITIELL